MLDYAYLTGLWLMPSQERYAKMPAKRFKLSRFDRSLRHRRKRPGILENKEKEKDALEIFPERFNSSKTKMIHFSEKTPHDD